MKKPWRKYVAGALLGVSLLGMTDDAILARGKTDLRWLIETCFSLIDKNSQKVPFVFTRSQDHYWPRITSRDLIVKARKQGFSTIRLARMVAKCMTMKNRHCVVVSHEEKSTMRLLERAVYLIQNSLIKINVKITGNTISFPDTNSKIWIGTAGSKAFGRGDDITDYHLSEYAFWMNPGLITGIEEACTNDSEGCVESTANGWGTPYHKLWVRAEAKQSQRLTQTGGPRFYFPHFYGWFWDDNCFVACDKPLEDLDEDEKELRKDYRLTDGQLYWRRLKISSMTDPEKFPQEYPASPEEAFLVAGSMVFKPGYIRKQEQSARAIMWQGEIRDRGGRAALEPTKPDANGVNEGRLVIFVPPRAGSEYLGSGDVASGIEPGPDDDLDETGCYSVWDIFDCTTWEQVAQWRGLIPPDEFGEIGAMLGMLYNEAMLAPEVNNHGLTTCVKIRDLGYRKLYIRDDKKGGTDMGFFTMPGSTGTRAQLINATRSALRDLSVKVNSAATFAELRSFVRKSNGKLGPQTGTFSDTVITLGIGILLLEQRHAVPEKKDSGGRQRLSTMNRGSGGRITYPYKGGYG
jgi:hypothetical protein